MRGPASTLPLTCSQNADISSTCLTIASGHGVAPPRTITAATATERRTRKSLNDDIGGPRNDLAALTIWARFDDCDNEPPPAYTRPIPVQTFFRSSCRHG